MFKVRSVVISYLKNTVDLITSLFFQLRSSFITTLPIGGVTQLFLTPLHPTPHH